MLPPIMSEEEPEEKKLHFIEEVVEEDLKTGKFDGRVVTRFPPEPNGYLHIGHSMAICLSFGIAAKYGGTCHLRFDDTNPAKEETQYVEAIKKDIEWLAFVGTKNVMRPIILHNFLIGLKN